MANWRSPKPHFRFRSSAPLPKEKIYNATMGNADKPPIVYTIYRTINNKTGHFYVGIHRTREPYDDYLGSGVALRRAVKKYGEDSFTKYVLWVCSTREEAVQREKHIVGEVKGKKKCYNKNEGGYGGFEYLNESGRNVIGSRKALAQLQEKCASDPEFDARMREIWSEAGKKGSAAKKKMGIKNVPPSWVGRKHSDESKKKISAAAKVRSALFNNSTGKMWISNMNLSRSTMVTPSKFAEMKTEGWVRGRLFSASTVGQASLS